MAYVTLQPADPKHFLLSTFTVRVKSVGVGVA